MCVSLGGFEWIKDVWFEGSDMPHKYMERERKWKEKQQQEWSNVSVRKEWFVHSYRQQPYSLLSNDCDCVNKMFKFIQNDSSSNEYVSTWLQNWSVETK